MKKVFLVAAFILCMMQMAFAGQLKQDVKGFYYVKDNGSYAVSEWVTIDLDADGKEEYYYFYSDGYMVISGKTPDGYDVNSKGQWVKNGKVQTKDKIISNSSNNALGNYYSGITDAMTDAYSKSLDAGIKAVEAGMDLGAKVVEDSIDAVGNMYGDILKGAANDYKDAYKDAMDEYKKEYNKAMNEYSDALKDYSNQLSNLFK
jgi:hypothetical protein